MSTKIPPPILFVLTALGMWWLSRSSLNVPLPLPFKGALSWGLISLGAGMALLAAWQFRRANTTIDPRHPSKTTRLVTSGMFSISRNPMYLGMVTILLGVAVRLGTTTGLILLPVFMLTLTLLQIRPEEAAMSELFGDVYRSYCADVRRWL